MTDYRDRLRQQIGIKPKVRYKDGVVTIRSLKDYVSLKGLIHCIIEARHEGFDKITLDFSHLQDEIIYPNIAVSTAAFIENLRIRDNVSFTLYGQPESLEKKRIFDPGDPYNEQESAFPINKVWKFTNYKDASRVVSSLIGAISEAEVFEHDDIIRALEWCVSETVDNVVRHAEIESGYIMCQIHGKAEKQIVFSVADAGCGIYNSLLSGGLYAPTDGFDAITLALKRGVSRTSEGQGNGLWGLGRIIENNKGTLSINTSGSRMLINGEGRIMKDSGISLARDYGGTVVDFQFHYDQPVSLVEALDGHEPESIQYINAWSEDSHAMIYKIEDSPLGTGTRPAGLASRNYMMNMVKQNNCRVIVDFSGIGVVASSFADEMIAKVYSEMGPIKFNNTVQLANMNSTVQMIVNTAIEQRLVQDNYKKYIDTEALDQ